ncbi:hypothetical protein BD769DRAFT_1432050 [Suillus cothurnatus]|nr:hypothetical protein BD769DRAFT_1432050 [Suillus cothurnatus]
MIHHSSFLPPKVDCFFSLAASGAQRSMVVNCKWLSRTFHRPSDKCVRSCKHCPATRPTPAHRSNFQSCNASCIPNDTANVNGVLARVGYIAKWLVDCEAFLDSMLIFVVYGLILCHVEHETGVTGHPADTFFFKKKNREYSGFFCRHKYIQTCCVQIKG